MVAGNQNCRSCELPSPSASVATAVLYKQYKTFELDQKKKRGNYNE
jgi:hypothetical protein